MNSRFTDSEWFYWVRLSIKFALVFGALYVGYHLYERNRIASMGRDKPEPKRIELPKDAFAFVPKSYVTDLESARRKLIGKPLWIKEGYRWPYQPGGKLFGPLEKIVPKSVGIRGAEAVLTFDRDGRESWVAIGTAQRVYVDDMFFIKDPKEIYDHWTEEMWTRAGAGEVEVGMSEIQIGFALGVGELVRQSPGGATRIVDYKQCAVAGHGPVRVTYRHHVASSIEPLQL